MQIEKAKEYRERGYIEKVWIHGPNLLRKGWWISFSGDLGNAYPNLRAGRGREAKLIEFKTLDEAAKVVSEIGFSQFSVNI